MKPPLYDNALLIDNSSLELLQTCPISYVYSQCEKRILNAAKPSLNFGGALHASLASRYRMLGGERPLADTTAKMHDVLSDFFTASPQSEGDYRSPAYASLLVAKYNDTYQIEPWSVVKRSDGSLAVESSFALPFGTIELPDQGSKEPIVLTRLYDVYYTGRIDLIVSDSDGLWVLDHKTSSVFGQTFWDDMAISAQMRGYMWAVSKTMGKLPVGYIINGIRTRPPTKAAEYDESSRVRPAEDFCRNRFYAGPDDIVEWEENTKALLAALSHYACTGQVPRHRKNCVGKYGKCQYYDVCSLPSHCRKEILASDIYAENTWSPLNKPNNI